MILRDRLIFGTARLSGGAYARRSRHVIEACLQAGIRRFDTAPSYGMGAAEQLLGEVTCGIDQVAIHTKAGAPKPAFSGLRGWAKALTAPVRRGSGNSRMTLPIAPYRGPDVAMNYTAAALQTSLARSHDLLRREVLDLALLHEAEPRHIDAASWAVFEQAAAQGSAREIGFAHFGPLLAEHPGLTAQIAPCAADFAQEDNPGKRIFHSIRRATLELAGRDPGVAARLATIAGEFGLEREGAAGEYLAALLLLARIQPRARLIFATGDPAHLGRFLSLLGRVEGRS